MFKVGDRVVYIDPYRGTPSGLPLKFDYPFAPQRGTVFCVEGNSVFVVFDWERDWFSRGMMGAAPAHPISYNLIMEDSHV